MKTIQDRPAVCLGDVFGQIRNLLVEGVEPDAAIAEAFDRVESKTRADDWLRRVPVPSVEEYQRQLEKQGLA